MQMKRSPGKSGSHFNPYSDLFQPHERKYIVTSTVCWTIMTIVLFYLCTVFGTLQMLNIYGIPYLVSPTKSSDTVLRICHKSLNSAHFYYFQVFVMWLDFVTYLHHHGYEKKLPWYRGKVWDINIYIVLSS